MSRFSKFESVSQEMAPGGFVVHGPNGQSVSLEAAQEKLAELATRASKKRGIPVLISNHDLPLTRSLYHGADFSMLSVKRSISQNGAKRQPVDEILAYFPPANVTPKRNTRKKKTFPRPSV